MHVRILVGALVLAALTGCSQRTAEQQIIDDATAAVGGSDRLAALSSMVIEGSGVQGNLGQDMTPDAAGQTFALDPYRQRVDLSTPRTLTEQTRTPSFDYFQGRDPQAQMFGLDGDIAYAIGSNGTANRQPAATARDRRAAYYHHPVTVLRAAADPAATVTNARTESGERLVDLTTADGVRLTLATDATSNLPARVTSMTDHPNLGDVTITTRFSDYAGAEGLMLPTRLTATTDEYAGLDLRVTSHAFGGDVADLAAPAAAAAATVDGPAPPNVTVEELASGIWFLAGESHHSVLVEYADHLMLIEAPNDARTLAVVAKARELVPDKPLTHLVNSHHHFDHSGGIRTAISEGLTIVTQAANGPFYEHLATRARTIAPDALTRNPQPLTLETVDEEWTHEDASMSAQVYRIAGSSHADTLLMVYFPQSRLLVQADAFSPGRPDQPFAANLLEEVERRELRVDRIAPIHGVVTPFSELVSLVRAASN